MSREIETMTLSLYDGHADMLSDAIRMGELFADNASEWMWKRKEADAAACMKALAAKRDDLGIGALTAHLIIHKIVGRAYRKEAENGEWKLLEFKGAGLPLIHGNDFMFSRKGLYFIFEDEGALRFAFTGGDPLKYLDRTDIEWTDALLRTDDGRLSFTVTVREKGEDAFGRACGIKLSSKDFCIVSSEETGVNAYPGAEIMKTVRKMERMPDWKKMGRYDEYLKKVMDEVSVIIEFLSVQEDSRTLFVTEYIEDGSEELLSEHPDPFWMTQAWRVFLVMLREHCDRCGSETIMVRKEMALEYCPVCGSDEIYVLDHDLVCTSCSSKTELNRAAAVNLMKIGRAVIEDRSINRMKEAMET